MSFEIQREGLPCFCADRVKVICMVIAHLILGKCLFFNLLNKSFICCRTKDLFGRVFFFFFKNCFKL